ncbi:TolC family protein [Fulvivirga maritima]|uniref:TolC family protein n=1 Tax=Fulvivirga maritima TaxID=2904247 RepID=UPI001F3D797F|nr:TolC family protein [Fulvivirga maritima]UII24591.1 TolC family protein [Fulvivirga maritima]
MRIYLIVIISAISLAPVFGQQADTTTLSFKEAVNVAIKNNNTLAKENNEMIFNQVQKASSIASLAPSVEGNASVRRTDGNSFNQQEGRVINGKVDYVYGSIDAEITVFNGFNKINSMRQANKLVDFQAYRVKRTREDVIQQVASQYLQCLLDRELRDIDKANLKTQQEKLHQIEEQVKAGSVAEVDQYNQAYQVKSAELAVLRSTNTLNNDKVQLALLLQRAPELPFVLQEPDWKLNEDSNLNIDELYQVALDNRADLRSAESMERASYLGYKASQGNYYPSIAAFYSYGSAYNYVYPSEAIPDPANRTFEQQFTQDNTQSVYGFSMNIPIFRGLQTRSNVVRSKIDYENAELDAKNTQLQVKSDVLLAYQNLNDALNAYLVSQSQLEAAEVSFELESERNRLGISDLVQYTQANQDYNKAQNDAAQARYTLMFQNLLLDYALGTLTFESIP